MTNNFITRWKRISNLKKNLPCECTCSVLTVAPKSSDNRAKTQTLRDKLAPCYPLSLAHESKARDLQESHRSSPESPFDSALEFFFVTFLHLGGRGDVSFWFREREAKTPKDSYTQLGVEHAFSMGTMSKQGDNLFSVVKNIFLYKAKT